MNSNNKALREQNSVVKANPISELFYCYMLPIFWRNYKHSLEEEDLYAVLDGDKASCLGDTLEEAWRRVRKSHPRFALHLALLKVHGFKFAFAGILRYIGELVLLVVVPFSIRKLVQYFDKGPPFVTENEAYIYTGALLATLLVNAAISHSTMLYLMHMGMKMRVACCSLIYRKALRLNLTYLGETTIGQAVNLTSNDVRKFDTGLVSSHFIWIAPLQVIVATYLLFQLIGISSVCGMAFLILFIPLQIYLGKLNSVIRLRMSIRTDERVRLMNEILSGIEVIKMYTWEKPFAKLVSLARRHEIKQTRIHYYIESIIYGLTMFVPRTAIFISIVVYVCMGNNITAEIAFTITAVYATLRTTVSIIFSLSIIGTADIHVSLLRLQEFLNCNELPNLSNQYTDIKKLEKESINDKVVENKEIIAPPKITFKGVYAKWLPAASDYNLIDINLNIEDKKLIAVIGTVGSGKSTLLNAILKEVPISNGYIDVNGTVSYASQEPWLFTASVKHNILFGNEYDEERYRQVVSACALESDFKMFPNGDLTIVSEKGKSLSGGQKARINLARSVYKQADIYLLDDPLSAVDTKVGKELYTKCIKKFLSNKICILITHQLQYLKTADQIIIMEEGKIVAEDQFDILQHSDLNFAKLLKQFNSEEEENAEIKTVKSRQSSMTENEENDEIIDNKETVTTGSISVGTYTKYFRAGGSVFTMILLFCVIVCVHALGRGGDYFVSYWVNLEQANSFQNYSSDSTLVRDSIIYIYSGIIFATIVLGLICPVFFYVYFTRASVNIHDAIFVKISHATMRFFNDNPIGRILNRFSKDMGIIDDYIPSVLLDVSDISFVFLGAVILICIVNIYLLIPTAVLVLLFFVVRTFYMHTSRSVKRIEAITRTPIFNHLITTMNGLSTIRAFNAQRTLAKEFDIHQDLHSSSWYLFLSSNRALGFYLDCVCIIFIGVVTCSFLLLNKGYYGGDIGLVITQMIYLSGLLQWGLRQWTELENNMTSVERVFEYTKQETEPVRKSIANLPKHWPEFGKIVFHNVSMRYKPLDAPVLNNLNFTIQPCEKIGIVGRTGAGKSSTITALFQLYNLEGSIIIDDVDTTLLPLEVLRPKISIIPQEPVLFSGTLKKNLDPFEEYDDKTLWNALEQVELKGLIADSPGGLSSNVSESGANFSVGQRQLICLARALIRNNKILVMDEATANVDPHTDALIQKTIRKCFANCTVLTVAHRLHTIMDSDRVLVMDRGRVVEFDHPHNLLQNTKGIFHSMVKTTGTAAAQKLTSIAEQSFLK